MDSQQIRTQLNLSLRPTDVTADCSDDVTAEMTSKRIRNETELVFRSTKIATDAEMDSNPRPSFLFGIDEPEKDAVSMEIHLHPLDRSSSSIRRSYPPTCADRPRPPMTSANSRRGLNRGGARQLTSAVNHSTPTRRLYLSLSRFHPFTSSSSVWTRLSRPNHSGGGSILRLRRLSPRHRARSGTSVSATVSRENPTSLRTAMANPDPYGMRQVSPSPRY